MEKTTNTKNQNGAKNKPQLSKESRIINTIIYIVAALLLITAAVLLFREFVYIDRDYEPNAVVTYKPIATPVSTYDKIPVYIDFVSEGRGCNIEPVGIEKGSGGGYAMGSIDDAKTAAWLSTEPYVSPGEVGNAVLAGHNLWKGAAGTFAILKDMQLGGSVAIVYDDGTRAFFEVIDKYESSYNDDRPMSAETDGKALLTLVTCKGDWDTSIDTSATRVVVICEPVTAP